jgi:hypothetical protein
MSSEGDPEVIRSENCVHEYQKKIKIQDYGVAKNDSDPT